MYVSWLSGPLFFVATLVLILWWAWTFARDENEWNVIASLGEAKDSGCIPNFDAVDADCTGDDGEVCFTVDADSNMIVYGDGCDEKCTQVYDSCYNTFIIWVGPFLVSLGLLFLSFFATFLRQGSDPEQETTKFVRVWLFLLFAMWVGASLAGAGAGVSATLAALVLASFIAVAIFLAVSYGQIERQEQMNRIGDQLVKKYGNHFDLFRGLLVVTCTPVFLVYLSVSFLIQRIRSIAFFAYSKPPDSTESLRNVVGVGWVTVEAMRLIREVKSWSTTKVRIYLACDERE